jgi:hypothetical protein
LALAVEWVGSEYHPDWRVAQALGIGVGVHHGRLPRALAHLIVKLFNEEQLRFLVCTSTLIEGVNTAAKNVIVFDRTVGNTPYDFFTFNNIRGRVGRMFKHFVGNAYLFHEPPNQELPFVDVPVLTQGEDTPTSLLMQIEEPDLTTRSRDRLEPYLHNPAISANTLRANAGVDLDAQVDVAERLHSASTDRATAIGWTGLPTYDQLRQTCELVWVLAGPNPRTDSALSSNQLTFRMWRLQTARGDIHRLISDALQDSDPNDAVEGMLDFMRYWPGHHFPRLLAALQRIEEEVFPIHGHRPGNYAFYNSRVEQLFLPRFAAALEEYGLPSQVAMKVPGLLRDADSLDVVLERLRQTPNVASLTHFEQQLLAEAVATL